MSDYTPSLATAREVFIDGAEGEFVGEDFDRMIEAVRAEEREKADQELSDAAVEAAARAMAHADVTNPDGWVMTEEARNVYSDMARAALIAAQEVRNRG